MLRTTVQALLAILLPAASTYCAQPNILATSDSREVYPASDGRILDGQASGRLTATYPDSSGANGQSSAIFAFRLPTLPTGKTIAYAKLHIYYYGHYTGRTDPTQSLYGIPYRTGATPNITCADQFRGAFGSDTTDAVPLGWKWVSDIDPNWIVTDVNTSLRLKYYLQDQYKAGAVGNNWILLRINADYDPGRLTRHEYANTYLSGGAYTPYIEWDYADTNFEDPVLTTHGSKPEMSPYFDTSLGIISSSQTFDATTGAPKNPIFHRPYYLQERELFGWEPRFAVNSATFDANNRPYIRGQDAVYTINNSDQWISYNFKQMILNAYPSWNGKYDSFNFASDDRVVFDNAGDAYMLVRPNNQPALLMHSKDRCKTWRLYPLPESRDVRIEFRDKHNDLSNPPAILARTPRPAGGVNYLKVTAPVKNANGTLFIPDYVRVGADKTIVGQGLNAGKGASNLVVSKGSRVYIVFAGDNPENGEEGTPAYAATWVRGASASSPTKYLGTAGAGIPDGHNWPAITIDSTGVLHVILAAHGAKTRSSDGQKEHFRYIKTTTPQDINYWTAPVELPTGLTYPSLVCDASNNLHMIARDYWEPEMRLKYMTKAAGSSTWSARTELVRPWDALFYSEKAPYCHYGAKLGMDRSNRLYVTYYNRRNINWGTAEYNATQEDAFHAKYEHEEHPDTPMGIYEETDDSHDPAMLVSSDGGLTWRLALTRDFTDGF